MNAGLNDRAVARFAPAENLYDAIRLDVGHDGIDGFEPLSRLYDGEPPFSEIDEAHEPE